MRKHRLRSVLCFVLALLMLWGQIPLTLLAEEEQRLSGKVVAETKVNIRTGPGTGYSILTTPDGKKIQLTDGHEVSVGESVESEDPDNPGYWYEVNFTYEGNPYSGYIYSIYVSIDHTDEDIVIEEDFEKLIADLPEDYKDPLRLLHTLHPTWKFKILDTGLDWKEAVDNECVYGRSLTDSSIEAQRSTEDSCYNWLTDEYTPIEGKTWFQASRAAVEYYMDPRNFLTEDTIFQFEALSYEKSTQTISGVEKILAGSFMDGVKISDGASKITYAEAYMKAAAASNVSPYHLAARTIQEVGKKGGKGTTGNTPGYEGYYNFYNIGATTGVTAGLNYAKTGGNLSAEQKQKYMLPWNSPFKSIVGGGIFIGVNYINKGQNTLYLEKFDVEASNGLYWHQYMANVSAAYSEGRNIYNTYKSMGLLDSSLTFIIPVFKNMPAEKCALPTKDGSINNHLSSLTVGELPLTPTFSHDVTTYSIVLEDSTLTEVNVIATRVTELAQISGSIGSQTLTEGLNTLTITVTAENGDKNYYTVYIATSADLIPETPPEPPEDPDDPPATDDPEPPKPTGSYAISLPHNSWQIWGIPLGSDLSVLIQGLGLTGTATARVDDIRGVEVTEGIVKNGMVVTITIDGTKTYYRVVLYGDVDCDGAITAADLLMIRRNILGTYDLDAYHKPPADPDRDGKVTAADLLMVRRAILGTYTIEQS